MGLDSAGSSWPHWGKRREMALVPGQCSEVTAGQGSTRGRQQQRKKGCSTEDAKPSSDATREWLGASEVTAG